VFAVIVKQIHVMPRNGAVQPCAHFTGKHVKPQALRLADFVLMVGPRNRNTAAPSLIDDLMIASVK
jgi:hypothetical protein